MKSAVNNSSPFDRVPNRCPLPELRTECRVDPFWTRLWGSGSQASWVSRAQLEQLCEAGVVRTHKRDTGYSPTEARRILLDHSRQHRGIRAEGLAAQGVLFQHRSLTSQQVATITGTVRERTSPNTVGRGGLGLGFAAGLIERGEFVVSRGQVAQALPSVWRPALASRAGWLVDSLTYSEWVAVTAGRHLTFGSQHDRHNLVNAELLLRAAEMCPRVAGVAGEAISSLDGLTSIDEAPGGNGACADGVLIRDDGLRIAIESQASTAIQVLGPKIERWVRSLALTSSLDEGGVVVLFVAMADPRRGRSIVNALYKIVAKALNDYPWSARQKINERIAVASWTDFFPSPRMVDADAFPGLKVLRPTGTGAGRWEPVSLLDPANVPFNPTDPDAWTGAATNLAGLWGTPFWLRGVAPKIDWERFLFMRGTANHPVLAAQFDASGGKVGVR